MVSIQIFVARCPETQPPPFLRHLHSLHGMRKDGFEGVTQPLRVVWGHDGVDRLVVGCRRVDWLARAERPPPDASIHACSEQEPVVRVDCDSLKLIISRLLLLGNCEAEAYEFAIVRIHVACKCDERSRLAGEAEIVSCQLDTRFKMWVADVQGTYVAVHVTSDKLEFLD